MIPIEQRCAAAADRILLDHNLPVDPRVVHAVRCAVATGASIGLACAEDARERIYHRNVIPLHPPTLRAAP